MKLYRDHNTLWVKHATYKKDQSLRAASLSKLDNTVSNNSISNTNYAEFSIKSQVLLYYHNPNYAYNHLYNLHQKSVSPLQSSLRTLIFAYNHFNNLHQKYFSLSQAFSQFRLHQGTRELGSLVMNDIVLTFPFFLKVWTVITELTITDFLSLRLSRCTAGSSL